MGSCDGPYSFVIMYDAVQRVLSRTSISGQKTIKLSEGKTLFQYMQSELDKQKCSNTGLPFDFNGGFIGYFGYEMKLECGAYADEYSKVKYTIQTFSCKSQVAKRYMLRYIKGPRSSRCSIFLCGQIHSGRSQGELHLSG